MILMKKKKSSILSIELISIPSLKLDRTLRNYVYYFPILMRLKNLKHCTAKIFILNGAIISDIFRVIYSEALCMRLNTRLDEISVF